MTVSETQMATITVFHGSDRIVGVEDIVLPGPRRYYDFGPGFYLTESRRIAEEWAIDANPPLVNEYRLTLPKREILHLRDRDWLQVVVGFRSKRSVAEFKSPVIYGLIANDRLVDAIEIFRQGAIGDLRLLECLQMVELENQYVLRENVRHLAWIDGKEVTGQERQRAVSRRMQKRRDIDRRVKAIYRKQVSGEMFYDDFLEMGAYRET